MTSLRGGAVEGGREGGVVETVTRYDVIMQQWMLTQQHATVHADPTAFSLYFLASVIP